MNDLEIKYGYLRTEERKLLRYLTENSSLEKILEIAINVLQQKLLKIKNVNKTILEELNDVRGFLAQKSMFGKSLSELEVNELHNKAIDYVEQSVFRFLKTEIANLIQDR